MKETQEMHPSNSMFQMLIGKTVSAVEYVDDFDEGITLRFTDGSFVCVCEETQAGRIQVAASIAEPSKHWACPECGREYDDLSEGPCPADDCPSHEAEPVAEAMSLHEALRLALSTIYATLDDAENADTQDWITPPDALREAARIIDTHMRSA